MQKEEGQRADRVVIIDDDRFVRDLVMHAIEYGVNRKVTAFDSGFKAWQYVQEQPHAVDVIIADANLPDMDGFELLSEFKRQQPQIAFILTTSNPIFEQRASRLGADAFLLKPFSIDDIFQLVQQFIMINSSKEAKNIKLLPNSQEKDQSAL